MLLNCGVGEDSWKFLGLPGDPINLWRSFCWQCTQTLRIAAHSNLCYSGPLSCKEGCKSIFLNAFHLVCVHGPQWQVQFSCSVVQPLGLHTRPPCPSPTPRVYSNSCPLSWWCHPTISYSVIPFSSHLQSIPASGSFQMNSSSHHVAKVLEFQLQHRSFQWIFRTDFL